MKKFGLLLLIVALLLPIGAALSTEDYPHIICIRPTVATKTKDDFIRWWVYVLQNDIGARQKLIETGRAIKIEVGEEFVIVDSVSTTKQWVKVHKKGDTEEYITTLRVGPDTPPFFKRIE